MSYDDYANEYHPTEAGWVMGNHYYYGRLDGAEKTAPQNRLLTVTKSVTQASGWSRDEISFNEDWRAEGEEEKIKALLKKYPLTGYC